MAGFLLRRLGWFIVTLFVVMTVSFFLMRAVPGGPFDTDRALNEIIERNLQAKYHFDWPLWKQYLHYVGPFNLDARGILGDGTRWFGGVLVGELGPSFSMRDYTVNDIIGQSLPVSMLLGIVSLGWALSLGISAGMASALRPRSGLDLTMRLAATGGIALPNFVIAAFLIIGLVFMVPLVPVAGWGTLEHMLLPGLALGAPFAAYIARLTRTGMLEVMSADYIRTAYAKGMGSRTVILRHALKGGILPVVSYLGPATAGILTGSLVIEKVFNIPGTGSHFVNSALNRDYTLSMGVTILYTVLVYSLNLIVDMAYSFLDPRIKLEEA